MQTAKPRLVGVELYFEDLDAAKVFYRDTVGLDLSEEKAGHYAKFDGGAGFICLERKGSESYRSRDKAVLFIEVADLPRALEALAPTRIVQYEREAVGRRPPWAVIHDPEGHNVVLLQARHR